MPQSESHKVVHIYSGQCCTFTPALTQTGESHLGNPGFMGTANTLSPALPNTHPRLLNRDERREYYA